MAEYLLKIIVYHTLGNSHLEEAPNRKDSAETGTTELQLEPDGSSGLKRAVRRQRLEGLPRTMSFDPDPWRRPLGRDVLP